jgi:hypothetical protein
VGLEHCSVAPGMPTHHIAGSEPADVCCLQAVLRSGLEQAAAMEKGVLVLLQQLREVQEALREGERASSAWAGLHRARHTG